MVCRSFGRRRTIRSTCGWKPMSSIRSASSRTSTLIPSSRTSPRVARSSSRPGVAMSTWERSTPRACSRTCVPPYTACTRRPFAAATTSKSSRTCWASSRVGTRTSAAGRGCASGSSRSAIGIANPSVFPEPVLERARVSRPARASSHTIDWIGNGIKIPRSASACTTSSETPRSRKPTGSLLTRRGYRGVRDPSLNVQRR